MNFLQHKRRGQIFLFFLTLITISLLLIIGLLSLQSRGYRSSQRISWGKEASYLAEAGLDKGFAAYKASSSYTGETFNLGNGTITVTVNSGSTANEKYLISQATINGVTRRIRGKTVATPNSTGVTFNYAAQAGAGGFVMGNNSIINGSVYSNGTIVGSNGTRIEGNASAVGTISSNITVTGTKTQGVTPQPLPPFDDNFWKQKAQAGGTITGNYTPASNSTLGPKYITGNLILNNSVTITFAGPVYVAGSISFGNSVTMRVDNSLGNNGVMLISNQKISFGNSISVASNSSGGDLMVISTINADDAIAIGNGATAVNGPLYAPSGGIVIGNNARAVAFTANKITLGNGAIITFDSGLATESYTWGPGGSWTFQKGSYEEY